MYNLEYRDLSGEAATENFVCIGVFTALQPKTQLIAHDKEVYDIAFAKANTDVFASVGADGSVRLFDLVLHCVSSRA